MKRALLLILLFPVVGCSSGGSGGGDKQDDGGMKSTDAPSADVAPRDARPVSTSDGAVPAVPCGRNTCTGGMVCCDASCGTCAPPGGACPLIGCRPEEPDAGTSVQCTVDSDCRLYDDYCGGCFCRALKKSDPNPTCPGSVVACGVAPCMKKKASCNSGKCVAVEQNTGLRWIHGCSGIPCRDPLPSVRKCTANEMAGNVCSDPTDVCESGSLCETLICSADPPPFCG